MATSQMNEVIQHLRRAGLLQDAAHVTDRELLEKFISRRDVAALEVLVHRHGSMVWGVCRRVLGNHHDAEDAFQATFLVLVRKAASIRTNAGNWLYGVAHQTALKARAARAKRRVREVPVTEMPERAEQGPALGQDLQPLLDHELSLLPEKYRAAIVLCDLEGKTGREAARQLGCPEGTVASRLARARALLAKRLARHGLAVSGGTFAGVLSPKAASASVPAPVMTSTIKAVTLVAAGQTAATGAISLQVAALTEGVLKTMVLRNLKSATALLLVFAALVGGAGLMYQTQAQGQPKAPRTTEPAKKEKPTGEAFKAPGATEPANQGKPTAKVRWEYKAIILDELEKLAPKESKDKLTGGCNTLGDQGWELVAIQPPGQFLLVPTYVFKRPK